MGPIGHRKRVHAEKPPQTVGGGGGGGGAEN